jgi:hypothetical protein
MAEQLSFGLVILDPQAHRLQSMVKGRKCLSCAKTFQSSGPGNRICSSCKSHDAWQSGIPEFSSAASF